MGLVSLFLPLFPTSHPSVHAHITDWLSIPVDYFDDEPPPAPKPGSGDANNDEALVEQFRQEFLESLESRQQRKPAAPVRPGEKEAPKGPKLGGSRSARAAMREREEQAQKNKR